MSALPRTDVREALCAMRARHARVHPAPHILAGSASHHAGKHTRPCTDVQGCAVRFAGKTRKCQPCPAHAGRAPRYAGETRTCTPCPAHTCGQRFAICWRDTHSSALLRTVVRQALRAMQARHARVCPAQHLGAACTPRYAGESHTCPPGPAQMCWKRSALCWRDTHVSVRPSTYVWEALRAMRARHARFCPARHIGSDSASRCAGETRTCLP